VAQCGDGTLYHVCNRTIVPVHEKGITTPIRASLRASNRKHHHRRSTLLSLSAHSSLLIRIPNRIGYSPLYTNWL